VTLTFAIIILILGINRTIQRIVILIVSIVMDEIVFTSGFLIGLIGTLPHGILELFGFSLIAYAGQKFRCKNKPIMLILISFIICRLHRVILNHLRPYAETKSIYILIMHLVLPLMLLSEPCLSNVIFLKLPLTS
jgi:hypothetical protein